MTRLYLAVRLILRRLVTLIRWESETEKVNDKVGSRDVNQSPKILDLQKYPRLIRASVGQPFFVDFFLRRP